MSTTSRAAFLAELTVGAPVLLLDDNGEHEYAVDAEVVKFFRGCPVVRLEDGREVRLDSYGYAPRSHTRRIERATLTAWGWNESRALLAEENRAALLARQAA